MEAARKYGDRELGLGHVSSNTSANNNRRVGISVSVLLLMIITITNIITQRVVTTASSSTCRSVVPPQRAVALISAQYLREQSLLYQLSTSYIYIRTHMRTILSTPTSFTFPW